MKKLAALIIGATFVIPQSCAFAADDISVSALYDANANKVIINGRAAEGDVIVVITDSKNTEEISADNMPFAFFSVKSDGEFESSLTLVEEAGGKKLSVKITDSDGDSAQTTIMNPDFSGSADIIEDLNNVSGLKEFAKIISDNASALGIDEDDDLYKSKGENVIAVMYAIIKDDADSICVYDTYYKSHALVSLNGKKRADVEEILKNNAPLFGIDYEADYESDNRLNDDAKSTLCTLLSKADYAKVLSVSESFGDFLEKSKAVAAVSSAQSWQDIRNVMENDFADLFVITESGTKAQKVYSKMMKYDYSEFDDIKKGYKKAIESVENVSSESSSGGSSSSGSSSGGYGSSVKVPVGVIDDITIQDSSASFAGEADDKPEKQPMITLPETGYSNYSDVASDHWSYQAVSLLSTAGIVSGYPDGTFGVNANITRAEFAKLVCTSFGIPSVKAEFADVSEDAWYNGYVGGGAKFGLINGYGNLFGPNDFITRQDAAVIVYRALANEGIVLSGNARFSDAIDISLYAITAVGALSGNDIMVGNNSSFYPLNNITRAEAAQLIYKALAYARNM